MLSLEDRTFVLQDRGGRYILKPQHPDFPHLPENEDLTMRLAAAAGIEVPLHGLVYCSDGSLTYFVRRLDRVGRGRKLAVEDFAQLSERSRDTKYRSSMEQVAEVVDRFCTFPAVEKVRLLRRVVFAWLVGNEDQHLKNFSLIRRDGKVMLWRAYYQLNSTIALASPREEIALPLAGRKRNLSRRGLLEHYGQERLGLPPKVVGRVEDELRAALPAWPGRIGESFLPETLREAYLAVLAERAGRLWE